MIFISILILIVAIALPSINKLISPILFTRISSIVFIYAGALSFNALYIQSIGSGIGIYSGLFQVTTVSQLIDTFIFVVGSLILVAWPTITRPGFSIVGSHNVSASIMESVELNDSRVNAYPTATEYSLVVLFSTLGASLLVSSADLISMYLSIELQSFGVYILTTLYRDSESATSAGLKYFLLGGLSSCLILLGSGIVYTFTGLTNFESLYSLVSVSYSNDIVQGLNLGFILIVVGFLFKIAAAPLHHWAPDVYDDSPTIVTIWLTIMPKISIVIFILELYTQIGLIGNSFSPSSVSELFNSLNTLSFDSSAIPLLQSGAVGDAAGTNLKTLEEVTQFSSNSRFIPVLKHLLLLSSLISLIIGTIVGLAQSKIKRLLAYSTISHIGFILLALAINTEQSIDSLIFYILQYSLTNLNTFLILIAIGYIATYHSQIAVHPSSAPTANGRALPTNGPVIGASANGGAVLRSRGAGGLDIKYISELKGLFFSNPLLSLSLSICLFSMAGVPPLLGFFSKQFVLYSAIQSGYYFMSIVAIVVSIISASYYIKIIRVLHTETESVNIHSSTSPLVCGSSQTPVSTLSASAVDATGGYTAELVCESESEGKVESGTNRISNFHSFLISTLTISILFFILKPSTLLNSTQLLSLSLFNF